MQIISKTSVLIVGQVLACSGPHIKDALFFVDCTVSNYLALHLPIWQRGNAACYRL